MTATIHQKYFQLHYGSDHEKLIIQNKLKRYSSFIRSGILIFQNLKQSLSVEMFYCLKWNQHLHKTSTIDVAH